MMGTSLATGTAGDWEVELHGSFVNMNYRPQLQFKR